MGVVCIGGLYFNFVVVGGVNGMVYGMMVGCIVMLVVFGVVVVGFV